MMQILIEGETGQQQQIKSLEALLRDCAKKQFTSASSKSLSAREFI